MATARAEARFVTPIPSLPRASLQTLAQARMTPKGCFSMYKGDLTSELAVAFIHKKNLCKAEVIRALCPLRRERDSNPRNSCPFTAFRVRPDRPLRHLSNCDCKYRDNFSIHATIRQKKFKKIKFRHPKASKTLDLRGRKTAEGEHGKNRFDRCNR